MFGLAVTHKCNRHRIIRRLKPSATLNPSSLNLVILIDEHYFFMLVLTLPFAIIPIGLGAHEIVWR